MGNGDKIKALYDVVSKDYDIGTYDDFRAKLSDPQKAKSFYEGVGAEYDLGTYDEFSSKIGLIKQQKSTLPVSGVDLTKEAQFEGAPMGGGKPTAFMEQQNKKQQLKKVDQGRIVSGEELLSEGAPMGGQSVKDIKKQESKDRQTRVELSKMNRRLQINSPLNNELLKTKAEKEHKDYQEYVATESVVKIPKSPEQYQAEKVKRDNDILRTKYNEFKRDQELTAGEVFTSFEEWKEGRDFEKNAPNDDIKVAILTVFQGPKRPEVYGLEEEVYSYLADNPSELNRIKDRLDYGGQLDDMEKADLLQRASYPLIENRGQVLTDLAQGGVDQVYDQLRVIDANVQKLKQTREAITGEITANPLYSMYAKGQPIDNNNPNAKKLQKSLQDFEKVNQDLTEAQQKFNDTMTPDARELLDTYNDVSDNYNKVVGSVQNNLDRLEGFKAWERKRDELDATGSALGNVGIALYNVAVKTSKDILSFVPRTLEVGAGAIGLSAMEESNRRIANFIDAFGTSGDVLPTKRPESMANTEKFFTDLAQAVPAMAAMIVMGRPIYTTLVPTGAEAAAFSANQLASINQKAAMLASVMPAYVTTFNQYAKDAEALGYTGAARALYSGLAATFEGVSETIFPEWKFIDSAIKNKALKSILKEKITDPTKAFKLYVQKVLYGATLEGIEEASVDLFTPLNQALNNIISGNGTEIQLPEISDLGYTMALGAVLGGGVSTIGALSDVKRYGKVMDLKLATDYDNSVEIIKSLADQGEIKPDVVQKYIQKLNRYANQLSNLPTELAENVRAAVLPIQTEIADLKEKNKNPDLADAFKVKNEERIEVLNAEIGAIINNPDFNEQFNEQVYKELNQEEDAVSIEKTASVLQRESEEVGVTGSERGRVESGIQREEVAQESKEEKVVDRVPDAGNMIEDQTFKEGDVIKLPPQLEGGLPRVMEFKDGIWQQKVGNEYSRVSEQVQNEAALKFIDENFKEIKPGSIDVKVPDVEKVDLEEADKLAEGYGYTNAYQLLGSVNKRVDAPYTIDQVMDIPSDVIEKASSESETVKANKEKVKEQEPKEEKVALSKKEKKQEIESKNEKLRRKLTKRISEDKTLRPEIKEAFSENAIYYHRLPVNVSIAEANTILSYYDTDMAIDAVLDTRNGMHEATRTVLAAGIFKRLQAEKDYDKALDFYEKFVERSTEIGQGINAYKVFREFNTETIIYKASKQVKKDRERRERRDSKRIGKLLDGVREANKDGVEAAIRKVVKKIEDVSGIDVSFADASYGSKNKVFTKKDYLAAKKSLRGKLFTSVIPPEFIAIGGYHIESGARSFADFSKAMIKEVGNKIKPYLRTIYDAASDRLVKDGVIKKSEVNSDKEIDEIIRGEKILDVVNKLEAATKRKSKKDIDKAISELQEVAKETGLWDKYRSYAVSRLKNIPLSEIAKDVEQNPALQDFTTGLIKNLTERIQENLPEKDKQKVVKRKAINLIGDAFSNIDKYSDVWHRTQDEFKQKHKGDPETLELIDAYFGPLLDKPFSDKTLATAVKEGLKSMDVKVADIIKQHYTVYSHVKKSLAEKLIDQAGLSGAEAQTLSDAVQKEFDRVATQKKQELINRLFGNKTKKTEGVGAKTLEQEIVELTNIGVFSDKELVDKYAEKMGWPKLTADNVKAIEHLSNKIQEAPTDQKKFRAIEDLLKYQADIRGTDWMDVALSVWYANILSGYTTQEINIFQNFMQTMALSGIAAFKNPKEARMIPETLYYGFMRSLSEAVETLKTGYSPIRGKVEVPQTLERLEFKGGSFNPANHLKYVRRFIVASDVVFFETLKELRAWQLAIQMAAKKKRIDPSINIRQEVVDILNRSSTRLELAKEQALIEYEDAVRDINAIEGLSEAEKKALIGQEKRDMRRRYYDIIQKEWPTDVVTKSAEFAARGTFNHKPEGVLGFVAKTLNQAKFYVNQQVRETEGVDKAKWQVVNATLNLTVPFVNIVANVFNETLNYTPYGFGRIYFIKNSDKVSQDQKDILIGDQRAKAIMGTALMSILFALSQKWDDEEDPVIQITANGTGNYRENYNLKDWQKFSIKIGDRWWSYQYSPFFFALAIIGNYNDYKKYRKDKEGDDGIATRLAWSMFQIVPQMFETTFLEGLAKLIDSVRDPGNEQKIGDLLGHTAQAGKSFVQPNLAKQLGDVVQDIWDITEKEIRKNDIIGQLLKDIPIGFGYGDKVNALGEPVMPKTGRITDKFDGYSKAWDVIAEKKAYIATPLRSSLTEYMYDEKSKEFVQKAFDDKQYHDYVKKRGEIIRGYIEDNYDRLMGMEEKDAQEEIKMVVSDASSFAKSFALSPESQRPEHEKMFDQELAIKAEDKRDDKKYTDQERKRLDLLYKPTVDDKKFGEDLKKIRSKDIKAIQVANKLRFEYSTDQERLQAYRKWVRLGYLDGVYLVIKNGEVKLQK